MMNYSQSIMNYLDCVVGFNIMINFTNNIIEYFIKSNTALQASICEYLTIELLNTLLKHIKLVSFQSVSSCCSADNSPLLLILATDIQNRIQLVFFNLNLRTAYHAPFYDFALESKLVKAAITPCPSTVQYRDRRDLPHTNECFTMVIATEEDINLIFINTNENNEFSVKLMEKFPIKKADLVTLGQVSSICILPSDRSSKRMGRGDPQVLVGFNLGHLLKFRIRATTYSYKARRVRAPLDLSEFVEYPGCPITKISCARFYNSLHFMTAFVQEKSTYESSAEKRSYVRLIKTRGDASSQVKLTVLAPCSSAEILESTLVPASATEEDDQKQLNILFLNHQASSFNTCIWQITPKDSAKEVLNLSMNLNDCKTSILGCNQTCMDSDMLIKNSPQQVIQALVNNQQHGKKRELPDTPFEINASLKKRKGSTETSLSSQESPASSHFGTVNQEQTIDHGQGSTNPTIYDAVHLDAVSPGNEFIPFYSSQDEEMTDAVDENNDNVVSEEDYCIDENKVNTNLGQDNIDYASIEENSQFKENDAELVVYDGTYDEGDMYYGSQEDFDDDIEDGMILEKEEEEVYAKLSDVEEENEDEPEPLPTSRRWDGYAFGEVYFPPVVDDVNPLSPRYGNTDFTYHSEASFTDDYEEEDDYLMDERDILIGLVSQMFSSLFGKEMVDMDLLQRSQVDEVGNYCWESRNPHLMLFMLKFLSKEFMHEECVYLGRELLNLQELTGEDLEECLRIYRSSYFKVPEHVQASEPLNPFNEATKEQIEHRRKEYYDRSN